MTARWVLRVLDEPDVAVGVCQAARHNFDRLAEVLGPTGLGEPRLVAEEVSAKLREMEMVLGAFLCKGHQP